MTSDRTNGAPGEHGAVALRRLQDTLCAALPQWSLPDAAEVRLLHVSENATFDVEDRQAGRRLVVRIYRADYHEADEIESELAWISALQAEGSVRTHRPVAGADGRVLQRLASPGGGPSRLATAFDFVEGREPDAADDLPARFRQIGAVTARLNVQARDWRRPAGFRRKSWTFATTLGAAPLWGRWEDGLGLDPAARALLARAVAVIERRLNAMGQAADRFGLIHADLRLANLLADGETLTIIDFDDCGFGWFAYDFAAAISFMEHDPIVPALAEAWLDGYRDAAGAIPEWAADLPVFVMLRRILLVAWVASHPEAATAQALGAGFTAGTLALAETFLRRFG